MTASEQQSEELEVLRSIFDGDEAFTLTPENAVHYLFGNRGENRSFLLEIRWPPSYPDEIPEFDLDLFYNKHLNSETKTGLLRCLTEEAETFRGMPATYSLIELIKERFEQLMENQPIQNVISADPDEKDESELSDDSDADRKRGGKSEKLTKAQKRKQWDKGRGNEEKPRGWNWIDVVKHLSQTGHQ